MHCLLTEFQIFYRNNQSKFSHKNVLNVRLDNNKAILLSVVFQEEYLYFLFLKHQNMKQEQIYTFQVLD